MSLSVPRLSPRKWILICVFLFAMVSVVVVAAMLERPIQTITRTFDSSQPVQYTTTRTVSTSVNLKAVVEGSIYETGSNMTVFGACEDGNGYLVGNSTANFTAWYPNGTIMIGPNASMVGETDLDTSGRFNIHVTMADTIGTYFTEMRCGYKDDYALAFGEWQNPEWVKKIGDNYQLSLSMNGTLTNISLTQDEMFLLLNNSVNQNLSAIIAALQNLNSTIVAQRTVDWTTDVLNTQFNASGFGPKWSSVDVQSKDSVYVGGRNGSFAHWNGYVWVYGGVQNVTWLGVSGVDSQYTYSWLVGHLGPDSNVFLQLTNQSLAVYSIGGSAPTHIVGCNATSFVDVKLFHSQNESINLFRALVLADDGVLYFSSNQGGNWTDFVQNHIGTPLVGGLGRISNIIWNLGEDFRFAVVTQGGSFLYHNQTSGIWQDDVPGRMYKDVSIRADGTGYVVGVESNLTKIWFFNKTSLTEVFATNDGAPGGIAAPTGDAWMVLDIPSIYYELNGTSWVKHIYGYAQNPVISLSFDTSGSSFSGGDISMSDENTGYAVSGGGLIMKFEVQTQLQQILTSIQLVLLGGGLGGGISDAQYAALIGNITFMQDYMNSTIMPSIDAILVKLGLMEATVNQTLEITNRTEQKVDILLNRTARPRVWSTP